MNYFIDMSNLLGKGPQVMAIDFLCALNELSRSNQDAYYIVATDEIVKQCQKLNNINFIEIVCTRGSRIRKYIYRFVSLFINVPKKLKNKKIDVSIYLGNYIFRRYCENNILLVHHPYLFDNVAGKSLCFIPKFFEYLKRNVFIFSLKKEDKLIAQSDYVAEAIKSYLKVKNHIFVIPNPISEFFNVKAINNSKDSVKDSVTFIYPARAYLHKNHKFIIQLARYIRDKNLLKNHIEFVITVNITGDGIGRNGKKIINSIKANKLDNYFNNIGEVSPKELSRYYQKADALFFPSKTESFGIPIIEAMSLGLPVIIPDKSYAKALCNDAALYYQEDSIEDLTNKIRIFINDYSLREKLVEMGRKRASKYPSSKKWVQMYLEVASSRTKPC